MDIQLGNLSKIIDFRKWQKAQDSLARATGLAIITIDYKGIPVTAHSECNEFCRSIRNDPALSKYCQKCDSRGGLEAVRLNKPYMYLCHYNLVDLAVPIIVDNKYLGAVMAGQVRLRNLPNNHELEQIISFTRDYTILDGNQKLYGSYEKIPFLDYQNFIRYADLINAISEYIISEGIEKLVLKNTLEVYTTDSMKKNRKTASARKKTINNSYILPQKELSADAVITPETPAFDSANELIQPAVAFIEEHKHLFLSAREASELCSVSPSYFSRIFKKARKIRYTDYIMERKLAWAKETLSQTNDSIETISDSLGFNSSSYFIKIFKKHENLTPTLYRKYYKD